MCRHAVGSPEDVEVVDERRAHVDGKCFEDAADRHAELLGFRTVDVGIHFGRAHIEERERLRDARLLAGRAGHGPCRSLKRRQSASGLVLDVTLQAAAGADAGNGGRFKDEYERVLQLAQLLAEIVQNARLL